MKASFIAGGGEARPGPAMRRAPLLLLALLLGSGLADSPRGKQRAARPREVLEAVSGVGRRARSRSARPAAVRAEPRRGSGGLGRLGGPSAAPLLEGWSAEPTASCERRKERRAAPSQRHRRIAPRPPSRLPTPPRLRCNRTPERRARPTPGAEWRRGIFRPSECGTLTWGRRREPRGYRSPPAGTAFRSDPPGGTGQRAEHRCANPPHSASFFTAGAERRAELGRHRALSGGRVPQAERRGSCRGARHRADSCCRGPARP